MSKKTRKKSSKSTSGPKGGKAKTAKRAPSRKGGAAATRKVAKKAKAKTGAARRPATKKTSAAASKRSRPKRAPARKTAAPVVRNAGALAEGQLAPAFSLPRDGGGSVSLADYSGRKLVIFFYPRADTPGCTLEAIAFSRLADAFAETRTAVLGVSADPIAAQEKFRDKHELTVPLVSDEKLGMLTAYGVWGEKSMYGKTFMGISRTTVLIDGDSRIVKIWRNVKVDGHADEVLAAARLA
ncbi:MAG: peroxiredoxin [Afipia sp.]|jgi:peroxiredoxin Q/BCP|nr:peroxiredoxin [Afipia sp.]MBS4006619.1 peroxiredoxin [Afipia sp.]WIG51116.1 MAG: Thiol peroxidase, Bcp-type [Afipia sp.]